MLIGLPKEIKNNEYRVAVTPAGAEMMISAGHRLLVETGAGVGSGFADEEYAKVGATVVPTAADAWGADMVVKVKEPIAPEYRLLRDDLLLFTYLHLAADEALTVALIESGCTAIAYETVQLPNGALPLLMPMSEVAGRMAVQVGAHYLEKARGGRGMLLGGVPGVKPAEVVVIGGGVVGKNAAKMALGMGARVTIVDKSVEVLRYIDDVWHGTVTTLASTTQAIAASVREADLVIGGVLVAGAKAPRLVTRTMISTMRPGSVIVDVAVDQGGCVETTHPTTHADPTYLVDGVVHYTVANMPGAVPRTSTIALSNATLPYVIELASYGFSRSVAVDRGLASGVNVCKGDVTCPGVAEAFGMSHRPVEHLLQ